MIFSEADSQICHIFDRSNEFILSLFYNNLSLTRED